MELEILKLEEELRIAMVNSDVNQLDRLLSPDLIFTTHQGKVISKAEDLEAHRKKRFVIDDLHLSNPRILDLGDTIVVSSYAQIRGTYNGVSSSENLQFTRIWSCKNSTWQVVAGHASVVV